VQTAGLLYQAMRPGSGWTPLAIVRLVPGTADEVLE